MADLFGDWVPDISIHAPRTGSDALKPGSLVKLNGISIHAPRTGSDGGGGKSRCDHRDFNPRSPHGERPFPSAETVAPG